MKNDKQSPVPLEALEHKHTHTHARACARWRGSAQKTAQVQTPARARVCVPVFNRSRVLPFLPFMTRSPYRQDALGILKQE